MTKFKTILTVFRISNFPTVWSNVLLFFFIANEKNILKTVPSDVSEGAMPYHLPYHLPYHSLLLLLFFTSVVYVLGMVWNDIFDFNWDKKNKLERPLVSGEMDLKTARLIANILLLIFASSLFFFFSIPYLFLSISLVISILLYNLLHKKTNLGTLFMAISRMHLYLISFSIFAETFSFSKELVISAIFLSSYIFLLTSFAKKEYADFKKESGTKFHIVFLLLIGLPLFLIIDFLLSWVSDSVSLFHFWEQKNVVSLAGIGGVLGFYFVWIFLQKRNSSHGKISVAVANLIAGISLLDSLLFFYFAPSTSYGWVCGVVLFLMFPLTLWGQRYIKGT